ncbi:MAG: hypothetical protein Q8880_04730 [Bacteroidota bacterium]|nr:hypothetical protein [Bacteroidota bacterium]
MSNIKKSNFVLYLRYFVNLLKEKRVTVITIFSFFLLLAIYFGNARKNMYEIKFCIKPFVIYDNNDDYVTPAETYVLRAIIDKFVDNYNEQKNLIKVGKSISNSKIINDFSDLKMNTIVYENYGKKNEIIEISLFVYDTSSTKAIIKDLINYINQTQIVRNKINFISKFLISKKEKLNKGLEEMIQLSEHIKSNKSQALSINFNLYRDITNTQNEIDFINNKLNNLNAVIITLEPENPAKPKGPSALVLFVLTILLGIVTSIVYIIFMDKLSIKYKN